MIVYDNHIYFSAYNGSGSSFGDLWKSDGTEEGTVPVTSTVNNLGPRYLTVFNDEIYFNGRDEDNGNKRFIWKSDGTEEGTVRVSDNTGPYDEIDGIFFSDFGGYLYFRGGIVVVLDGNCGGLMVQVKELFCLKISTQDQALLRLEV